MLCCLRFTIKPCLFNHIVLNTHVDRTHEADKLSVVKTKQLPTFVPLLFSLKDDDSGDHDQDQGPPKDCEKEKNEDEEKEQNCSKKKVTVTLLNIHDTSLCSHLQRVCL